jgi:hypothetical protein
MFRDISEGRKFPSGYTVSHLWRNISSQSNLTKLDIVWLFGLWCHLFSYNLQLLLETSLHVPVRTAFLFWVLFLPSSFSCYILSHDGVRLQRGFTLLVGFIGQCLSHGLHCAAWLRLPTVDVPLLPGSRPRRLAAISHQPPTLLTAVSGPSCNRLKNK